MKTIAGINLTKQIIKEIESKGFDKENIIARLKDLRPFAIQDENPLVTKVIRLTYEHIEENNGFKLRPIEEEVEVETDNDAENIIYMLQLVLDPDNPYNKEELQTLRNMLLGIEEESESAENA